MRQPCGSTWDHSPKHKVWDLCVTLEPLLDLQARLDAYGAMLPLQAGAFVNACVIAWLSLVESLIPQAVLLNLLSLLPEHSSCKHKRR